MFFLKEIILSFLCFLVTGAISFTLTTDLGLDLSFESGCCA